MPRKRAEERPKEAPAACGTSFARGGAASAGEKRRKEEGSQAAGAHDGRNKKGAELAEQGEVASDTIKRLQAKVAQLQAVISARDQTIRELQSRVARAGRGKGPADGPNSDDTALMVSATDILFGHWCDQGLLEYSELVHVSMACRAMHKKAMDCLKMMRRLNFRRHLLWPMNGGRRMQVVMKALGEVGGRLEVLDLSALGKLSETDSASLGGCESLSTFSALKELTLPSMQPFTTCRPTQAGTGNLSKNIPITAWLATLSSLEILDLSRNEMKDEGAIALAHALGDLRSLRTLELGLKNTIGTSSFNALVAKVAGLTSLQRLILPNDPQGEEWECAALGAALQDLTALQELDLSGNFLAVGSDGPETFGKVCGLHSSLQELRLANTNLAAERFNGFWIEGFLQTIPGDGASLRRLDLNANGFNTDGCNALAKVLVHLPLLEELDISDNEINEGGVGALCGALTGHNLQTLRMEGNDLGPAGVRLLAPVLSAMPGLTSLSLRDNYLNQGVLDLVVALPETLEELDLSSNKMFDAGVAELAKSLGRVPALKKLVLEENDISDSGVQALAKHLESTPNKQSLVSLSLIHNSIGDSGCAALMAAVSLNPLFQVLLLGENFIGEAGSMTIASALGDLPLDLQDALML